MAELVLDHNAEESELRDGHVLLRAHNFVAISDAADVFHGAIFIIWAHDMVDFCEGIACAKVALVEIQSRLSDAEHELVAEILNKRLAHKDTLGHVHGIVVLKHKIGASTDCVEISRDLGGLFELINRNLAFIIVQAEEPLDSGAFKYMAATTVLIIADLVALLDSIADRAPVKRATDDEGHLSLEIRLVEAGEDSEAVESFKLRVKILLVVGSIGESVQTNAVFIVWCEIAELYGVPALDNISDAEWDYLVLERLGTNRHGFVIDLQISDSKGLRVNEKISVAIRHSL